MQAAGAIPVPVYQDSVAVEMQYIFEHAGSRFAIVENQEQVDKLKGEVGFAEPGNLPNDGKVIEDIRDHD